MSLTWLGPVRGGVTKMGKNFFAFLDELDHLEAIKKYQFLMKNEGHQDPPSPINEKFSLKHIC